MEDLFMELVVYKAKVAEKISDITQYSELP